MYKTHDSLFLFFFVLSLWSASGNVWASPNKCSDIFSNSPISSLSQNEPWNELYKKSDLSPRPQVWLRIRQALQKNVSHLEHPLESAGQNPDKVMDVFKRMSYELPLLKQLRALLDQIDQGHTLRHADFIRIKRKAANQLIAISRQPNSDLEVFAALQALRTLSIIETKVEFPQTQEKVQKAGPKLKEQRAKQQEQKNDETPEKKDEEQEQKEDETPEKKDEEQEKKKDETPEKKDEEQEKKNDKTPEKKDEEQNEEEPEWNKVEDKYVPENKDVSQKSKGKKKKAVDIVLTDAEVPSKVLRQKIFNQFDLKAWFSVPTESEPVQHENRFTKKMIINSLGKMSIEAPVPYGYTLIPGQYPDYKVVEAGSGNFKVHFSSKNLVTLGLSRILKETYLPTPARAVNPQELELWPQHLLMFTQSLKGLSPIEAANRLKKYISAEGGFLYYSKGDKIDEAQLIDLDRNFKQLLSRMPKPMAMAHNGAFNCDGAAWIGALLLRDVLNVPVRIAGGRLLSGAMKEKLHVLTSSDPAHAWVEVFDGNQWVPFDMTPINNKTGNSTSSHEEEREETKPSKSNPSSTSHENQDEKDPQDPQKEKQNQKDSPEKPAESNLEGESETGAGNKKIEELIKAKSTQREKGQHSQSLIDRVLKRTELIFLEHLIFEGHQTAAQIASNEVLNSLEANSYWKNSVERSRAKIGTLIYDSKFAKFEGLQSYLSNIHLELNQNKVSEAQKKILLLQRLLMSLGDYRKLTKSEIQALSSLEEIMRYLNQLKHPHSREYEAVKNLLANLPGSISKNWLSAQYGKDYDKLGTSGNITLGQDIVKGTLKPLLQMAAVRDFIDMTLNSTSELNWKEEPTLNRSLIPKARQDLIITRNPLDFARMLWVLRPGESMFAPTLQGRQFAMGSLEPRRVPGMKSPLDKKISLVYYDISSSMKKLNAIETQDALLMAFVDKALSESDAKGRPLHEIYLIPFNDDVLEGVNITSREDAQNFIARRMNTRVKASGETSLQKVMENFYEIVAKSYKSKMSQGREKLFQRANLVLFTDGESEIKMDRLETKRKELPPELKINMNFVSIGDKVNETLMVLSENKKLATSKPSFRKLSSQMTSAIENISLAYDSDAFATSQEIPQDMLSEINKFLQKVSMDPRQKADMAQIDQALSQVKITTTDVSLLSGIKEALNLAQFEATINSLKLTGQMKQRLVESVVESYQQFTGRSWKEMTVPEKSSLEKLRSWALSP